MVTRKELLALLATLPPECEGCSAPIIGSVCEYCGRPVNAVVPIKPADEPTDIRKTNACDDPCGLCGLVHSTDPYAPVVCRCQKCGQTGTVGMSTFDPILGAGIVCVSCCRGAAPQNVQQLEAEAYARAPAQPKMPWEAA